MSKKEEFKEHAEEVKKKVRGMSAGKLALLIILTVGTICSFVFHDYIFGDKSPFINPDLGNGFLNALMSLVPKIVKSIQTITVLLLITTVVIAVVMHSAHKTRRRFTVCRLIGNLIKWVMVVVLVIAVLAIWGVDTTALITGAGVLTLVVGLGMQSLIADVVAGLFIVFENDFNIGDYITVDGFRGEVIEMGIRTTKLKAAGNVKIFNNSDIRAVLNQSADLSTAKSLIDIDYGESLARVEGILKEELPKMVIENAKTEVCYDGVSALGESGVTLQFTVKCDEGDIYSVNRELNRQLYNLFNAHNIEVPFNQLVVHVNENK